MAPDGRAAVVQPDEVGGGKPLDIAIDGSLELATDAEGQEVGDPVVVEVAADRCPGRDPVERVADEPGVRGPRMKERPHAELIAHGDEALPFVVPQDKGEVAGEEVDEPLAPFGVGAQTQDDVGDRGTGAACRVKACPKLRSRVEPDPSCDPVAAPQRVDGIFFAGDVGCVGVGTHEYGATQGLAVHLSRWCARRAAGPAQDLLRIDRLGTQIEDRGEQF